MASFARLAVAVGPLFANIVDFGAESGNGHLNTDAIKSAFAAVAAGGQGGTVYVPPGQWLTGPFNFTSSNTTLLLDENATLTAAPIQYWELVAPLPSYGRGRDFPGPRYQPFIGAYNLSNIRIASNASLPPVPFSSLPSAVLDGQGAPWWEGVVNGSLTITPGHLVEFAWCSDMEITNVLALDSPFWNLHIYSSTHAWLHDFAVRAPIHSTNTDGVDPDSSSEVLIEGADISTGDDIVAVKSGWNQAGVAYGVPSTNITIRRVKAATQSACLAIGSEMSGGVSNVLAEDIFCEQAGQALNVKSCLGRGGYIRNITFKNVQIGAGPINCALAATDNYKDQYPPAPIDPSLIPLIDGIFVANVTATVQQGAIGRAGEFEGLGAVPSAGMITGVVLQDIFLGQTKDGWECANVTGTSSNVSPSPCSQLGGRSG